MHTRFESERLKIREVIKVGSVRMQKSGITLVLFQSSVFPPRTFQNSLPVMSLVIVQGQLQVIESIQGLGTLN